MTYTPEMRELMKVVESTRPQRVGVRFPSMTMEERQQVLETFHPDYIKATMREIRVGVNKGSRMPLELADVLEGRPRIQPDFDLSQPEFETDVIVVGGGGPGPAQPCWRTKAAQK
jgi:FlaA1/EpsC-like NDP-sugar epimerase